MSGSYTNIQGGKKYKNKHAHGGSMLGRFAVPAGLLVMQKMMHRRTKQSKSSKRSKLSKKMRYSKKSKSSKKK